jgi:hypothetical protein
MTLPHAILLMNITENGGDYSALGYVTTGRETEIAHSRNLKMI